MKRAGALIGLAALLTGALVALISLPAAVRLPGSARGVEAWWAEAGPILALAGAARVGCIAVSAWLLVATILQGLAELCPLARGLRRAADAVAPRALRRCGRSIGGAALGVSLLVAPAPSARLTTTLPSAEPDTGPATATLTPLPEAGPDPQAPGPVDPGAAPAPPSIPTPPATPPAATPAAERSAVVAPGDSFWSVAEAEVAFRLGPDPAERDVARYWRALIAANADRLVVAGVPDLLFPGQVLRLPPLDGSPDPTTAALPATT